MRGHRGGGGRRWRGSWRGGGPAWYPSPIWYDAPPSTLIIAASDPVPAVVPVAVPVVAGDTKKLLLGAGIATAIFLLFR